MDKKRLLRSPLVWIAVVLVLYLVYSYFADDTRGYVQQNTSVALAQLKDGNVTDATIEVSASYFHRTFPESASTAVTWPKRCEIGS